MVSTYSSNKCFASVDHLKSLVVKINAEDNIASEVERGMADLESFLASESLAVA